MEAGLVDRFRSERVRINPGTPFGFVGIPSDCDWRGEPLKEDNGWVCGVPPAMHRPVVEERRPV